MAKALVEVSKDFSGSLDKNDIPLAGVLTGPKVDLLGEEGKFRLYCSSLSSSTIVDNVPQTDVKTTVYRVGVRAASGSAALASIVHRREKYGCVGQSFSVNEAIVTEISGINRKYSSYVAKMDKADFSSMLEYLAACMAVYGAYGELSVDTMRCGAQLQLRSLGVIDQPVAANANCVFIPRSVSTSYSPGAFSALLLAANATGSAVVSDVVFLDGNTNAPKVDLCDGADLAMGCYQAIRMLLSIMDVSGAGALGAYAVTRGLHGVLSVAGHTDEGAYLRDVLRRGAFVPSYGGVYPGTFMAYQGMPSPSIYDRNSFSVLVDGMALSTAALVGQCDPLVFLDGVYYPTVVSTGVVSMGSSVPLTDDMDGRRIERKIFDICGDFCNLYCQELCKLFLLNSGRDELAAQHLSWCFGLASDKVSRHCKFSSLAPFYWIEPTSLFKRVGETRAAQNGFGALCGVLEECTMPYFEDLSVIASGSSQSQIVVKYRSARTCGFVLHHHNNKLNGVASAVMRKADVSAFCMRGGDDEDISVSMSANKTLDAYLWRRGDAGIPAPAELLYTGKTMGMLFRHSDFNMDKMELVRTYAKDASELADNGVVRLSSSVPSYIGLGTVGSETRQQRRARTNAAVRLENVRFNLGRRGVTGGECFGLEFSAPAFGESSRKGEIMDDTGDSAIGKVVALQHSSTGRLVQRKGATSGVTVELTSVRPSKTVLSNIPEKTVSSSFSGGSATDNTVDVTNSHVAPGGGSEMFNQTGGSSSQAFETVAAQPSIP